MSLRDLDADGWRTVPLREVCQFKPAKSEVKRALDADAPVSFVPMSDLGELQRDFIAAAVRPLGEVVKSYTYFADGDVLCAKITPCFENGKMGVANGLKNGVGFGSSEFVVMRPSNKLVPEYLFYYILRDEFRQAGAKIMTGAVGHKRVPKEYFEHLLTPLPPLEEQKRIVAVLDKAFAALDRARALAEANLADVEELFERELACAFSRAADFAKPRAFEKLCKALTPKTKIMRKDYLEEGCYPIVSQEADLISGYWNDESALMGLDEPVVVFGDHTRCLKYIDFDFVVGADGTKVLKPHGGVDPLYLYYGLRSIPLAGKGYARHFRFLKEASLPDLGEDEQTQLADHMQVVESKISQLRDEYEAKLEDIDDLRQSLLQKAFAGELT